MSENIHNISCGVCNVSTVISRCLDCNEHLCKYCARAHQRGKSTKHHKTISEDCNSLGTSNGKAKEQDTCKSHPHEKLNAYCRTCSLLVCEECVQFVHVKHDFGKIDSIASKVKDDIFENLVQIKEKHISKLKSNLVRSEKYREEFKIHTKRIHDSVNQRTKELENEIRRIREKLTSEFDKVQKENEKVLNDIENNLKAKMFEIEKMSEAFLEIMNSASNIELLSAEHKMRNKIKNAVSNIHFNPALHLSHFITGNHVEEILKDAVGFIRRGEDFSSEFEGQDEDTLYPVFECNVVSAFNHKFGDILSVCPLNENEAWVHRKNESQNDFVNDYGIVKHSVELDFFIDDFAKMVNEEVLCSTYGEQRIVRLSKDGSVHDVLKTAPLHPRGICVSHDRSIIVCLMDDYTYDIKSESKRCVMKMTSDGTAIMHLEFDATSGRLFTVPYRVAENINKDICVVDRTSDTSGRLVVMTTDGVHKFNYNNNDSDKFIPNGVKCDPKGRILISDFWDKVHILDSGGYLLQYLVKGDNLIEFPQSIGLDSRGYLWVGCERGNIFIIHYKELGE